MTAKMNLVSTTFTVHAPAVGRPDYFLCKPRKRNGRFGAPVATKTVSPVNCKNCLRHPAIQYREISTERLLAHVENIRNERRREIANAVLREREDYWAHIANLARPYVKKG
jgi:hypothetical protein